MTAWWRRIVAVAVVLGTSVLGRDVGWGSGPQREVTAFDAIVLVLVVLGVAWFGWSARLGTGGSAPNASELRTRYRGALIIRRLGDVAMAPALIWAAYGLVTAGTLPAMPLWVMLLFVAGVVATLGAEAISWDRAP